MPQKLPDSLPVPHAILFDWDNTLVDSWGVIHDALNLTLKTYGHKPWTLSETQTRVGKSLRDSFPDLFKDRWKEAADTFYERFDEIHMKNLVPLEGVDDMLRCFSGKGLFMGVVSNKRGPYLRKEAQHLGWNNHFKKLIGALDASRDKPSPEPLEMALADSNISLGPNVWYVGDAPIDMECAKTAGCTGILLRKKAPTAEEFDPFLPTKHFSDCQTLCKHVDEL